MVELPSDAPVMASWVLRLLATELPRVRPGGDCTLHRLLTLSDRFIIALCTNPPIPFVGDGGRSRRSGDILPCEGDIANARASDLASPGGSNVCAGVSGRGEPMLLFRFPDPLDPLPYALLFLDGEDDRSASSCKLSGCDRSRDIPGICTREELVLNPWSDLSSSST